VPFLAFSNNNNSKEETPTIQYCSRTSHIRLSFLPSQYSFFFKLNSLIIGQTALEIMGLPDLPTELLLIIISSLEADRDLSSLAITTRRLYGITNDILYNRDARRKRPLALEWAAKHNLAHTARLCLSAAGPTAAVHGWALPIAAEHGSEYVVKLLLD
jgi:hypothetical protein